MITLCISAFNEEDNLLHLFEDLHWLREHQHDLKVVILDNGSTDGTWFKLNQLNKKQENWIYILKVDQNIGYGGGLRRAIKEAKTQVVALLSADRQYPIESVNQAISKFETLYKDNKNLLVYGYRKLRPDSKFNNFVSFCYFRLIKLSMGLKSKDINGQPKIFSKQVIENVDCTLSNSFFLDAQILTLCQLKGFDLIPCDVSFVNRKYGVSSWSGRKFKVYYTTLKELYKFKKELKKR